MAKINLLPWREELRAEKTRQFATILGLSAFMTVAVIATGSYHYCRSDQSSGISQRYSGQRN